MGEKKPGRQGGDKTGRERFISLERERARRGVKAESKEERKEKERD